MHAEDLTAYFESLTSALSPEFYVPRRFNAAALEGGAEPDVNFEWRGILREREPQLREVMQHPRLVILGEPGSGKSLVAKAAIRELVQRRDRVPVFSELKQYRGDLVGLLEAASSPLILKEAVERTYVLDGVDEIPQELFARFGQDLEALLDLDPRANVLLTARQAFYVAHRGLLPRFPTVFHVLDFSDDDIQEYLEKKKINKEAFLEAVRAVEAIEEIRNPFVLSVMTDRFSQAGQLSKLRSENLSYIVDRLIQSRPLVNQHRQRRALGMLAVALETYCRNELAEGEVLQVIKQAMRITDDEARQMLTELDASILRRTANGFAFQLRSYGEYLAAEALESESVDRLRELAFLSYDAPNESWVNSVGYLIEINAEVRKFFVSNYPSWAVNSSPAAFLEDEKSRIVRAIVKTMADDGYFVYRHPRINLQRLGRFVTPAAEAGLRDELGSASELIRGNALVLLGLRGLPEVVPAALAILEDANLDASFRLCAVLALMKSGGPDVVPRLIALLQPSDPLYLEILDCAGALSDESQISSVLSIMLSTDGFPSASVSRFREFTSREAVTETLRYFAGRPGDLNKIRAGAFAEPILKLLSRHWNEEVAEQCVEIICKLDDQKIYPDPSGIASKLFDAIRGVDTVGLVARRFLERLVRNGQVEQRRWYYADEVVASLMTIETAQWLISNHQTSLIKQFSRFLAEPIRDLLRPFSEGVIDAQEENARTYVADRIESENIRNQEIAVRKDKLSTSRDFRQMLNEFYRLPDSHWPELPADQRAWLTVEVSRLLVELDLKHSIVWKGEFLSCPGVVSLLLKLIRRYELTIDPDTPIVFVSASWDEKSVADYYRRRGLSAAALEALEAMMTRPPSDRALAGVVGFLRDSNYWSPSIESSLAKLVRDPTETHWQVDALQLLVQHEVGSQFIEGVAKTGVSAQLRQKAFELLVERQHRPTIERGLSALLSDEKALREAESSFPWHSSLSWIAKVKSEFALPKLERLRARTLKLEIPNVCGVVTEAIVKIDRARAAQIIRRQISQSPLAWRQAQQSIALDQERTAKVESIQKKPFELILAKLKGATSIRRLKLWCEGSTDLPVFRALLAQVPDTPEVLMDFVGGWPALCARDPYAFQHGCHEAIVVMDGDVGRRLSNRNKPLTKIARGQHKRFAGLPVELRVLERYGIENYFPEARLEAIVGRDLSSFFPIPDSVSVIAHLTVVKPEWWGRLKRLLAVLLHINWNLGGRSLYAKTLNKKVAEILSLDADLSGTDLSAIIRDIAIRARTLAGP
jgi:hypothetical protein